MTCMPFVHDGLYGIKRIARAGLPRSLSYVTIQQRSIANERALYTTSTSREASDQALYRSLLRECSYFPDRIGRQELEKQIKDRFHEYQIKDWRRPQCQDYIEERLNKVRAQGRKTLYAIQRANGGDSKALLRLLAVAYGRVGRRRRLLMNALAGEHIHLQSNLDSHVRESSATEKEHARDAVNLKRQDDQSSSTPMSIENLASKDVSRSARDATKQQSEERRRGYVRPLSPALLAIARSQDAMTFQNNNKINVSKIRRFSPDIPELNSWLRPMPKCRVKNMTKKWNANLLAKVLPSLSKREWLALYNTASGSTPLNLPTRRISQDRRVDLLDIVATRRQFHDHLLKPSPPPVYHARRIQRALQVIFSITPVLRYDRESKRFAVVWGQQALMSPGLASAVATDLEAEMAEMVDRKV